jgi:hypothetical protein
MEDIKNFIELKFNEQNKIIDHLIKKYIEIEFSKQNKHIESSISEYKKQIEQVMIHNSIEVQTIATEMGAKIDIMCNIEKPTNTSSTKSSTKSSKILTKNAFFKDKLKKNLNEYIDVLYTENDIDELKNHPDVTGKKTDILKKNKIIDILYNNITKVDSGKNIILKNIYDKYKENEENVDDTSSET